MRRDVTVSGAWTGMVVEGLESLGLGVHGLCQLAKVPYAALRAEPNSHVQAALAGLLVQRRSDNAAVVRDLVFHPNEQVRNLGKLFRRSKNDRAYAARKLWHILRPETPWLICDNLPFIHLMSMSQDNTIRLHLVEQPLNPVRELPIVEVREILKRIENRTVSSL